MFVDTKAVPAVVYLLADNLDSALAAGEDLLRSTLTWQDSDESSAEAISGLRNAEREALEAVRALEMVLIARVLKSRDSAAEVGKFDPNMRPIAKLYGAGTALLVDAVEELGDDSTLRFDSGDSMSAYLRSRGLISVTDNGAPASGQITISEDFLVCGKVPLGSMLDLVATSLDALETYYDLYETQVGSSRSGKSARRPEVLMQ